jgi:methionyl-tRNA formyltransferase
MRIVFWGSSDASAAIEKSLTEKHEVVLAVTQPDRAKGRGKKLMPTPVKRWSIEHHIPVITPEDPNHQSIVTQIRDYDHELFFLCAYARILGKELLAIPPKGAINLHFSLLPALRGAAPVQRAIMNGLKETGVTTFFMNEFLDRGEIILQRSTSIRPFETAGELEERLISIARGVANETLELMQSGDLYLKKQDPGKKSYAKKITKEERMVDWNAPAEAIVRHINGLSPKPGGYTFFGDRRIMLLKARTGSKKNAPPGTIFADKELEVAAGNQITVIIDRLKPEGKNEINSKDFINGFRIEGGETFQMTSHYIPRC